VEILTGNLTAKAPFHRLLEQPIRLNFGLVGADRIRGAAQFFRKDLPVPGIATVRQTVLQLDARASIVARSKAWASSLPVLQECTNKLTLMASSAPS
jgi:hypothetical protein